MVVKGHSMVPTGHYRRACRNQHGEIAARQSMSSAASNGGTPQDLRHEIHGCKPYPRRDKDAMKPGFTGVTLPVDGGALLK
jgi:hypothetical protein